jgi:hypothetical protein
MANLMTNFMSFINFVLGLTIGQVETDIEGQRRKVEALVREAWPHTKSYAFSDRWVYTNYKYRRGPSFTQWCWEPANTIPEEFTMWLWMSPSPNMVLETIRIGKSTDNFAVSVFATYRDSSDSLKASYKKHLYINLR